MLFVVIKDNGEQSFWGAKDRAAFEAKYSSHMARLHKNAGYCRDERDEADRLLDAVRTGKIRVHAEPR